MPKKRLSRHKKKASAGKKASDDGKSETADSNVPRAATGDSHGDTQVPAGAKAVLPGEGDMLKIYS